MKRFILMLLGKKGEVRTLARAATSALGILCIALALIIVLVAGIGIAGTRAALKEGNATANDELSTSTTTGQVARDMDTAYTTGEEAFLASGPACCCYYPASAASGGT
jgi:hypothetical protein